MATKPETNRRRATRPPAAGTPGTAGAAGSRAAAAPDRQESPIADQAAGAILGANPFLGIDPRELLGGAIGWMGKLATRPGRAGSEVISAGRELGRVAAGRSEMKPGPGDRRFTDPAWVENPLYRRLMQTYLVLTAAAHRLVDKAPLSPLDSQRAHMSVSLLADALAPTNALLSNPAALKRTFDTAGMSLLRGARNFVHDLRENGAMPATVDSRPFKVGGNIAVTSGAVVHRDEVFELIQYGASTETVHRRPVVVIPPQINKFYVLDLAPGRSFTGHVVGSGLTYFTISWRNPTAAQRDWGLDTYVQACIHAVDAAIDVTGSESVNLMGLCAGGVTMALLLGHLAATGRMDRVASATFAVAMLDMRAPSTMHLFASDAVVANALRRSREKGVLDGAEMARVFAWMRPNDLVWNYWVNNYLLGNDPPAFDILSWNADTTRLPAALHAGFLDLYVRNPLRAPGEATVLGVPIDLEQVRCPTYVLTGITDHIVPWKAGYRTTAMFGGPCEFVLSSSGHIQSIVNPPGNPKSAYYAGGPLQDDPDVWLRGATQARGTWWEHWVGWVAQHAGDNQPAPRALGSRRYPVIDEAPGRYVLQK
ncbi:MAG TPA: alpha/beta fold hydrolase [Candidatus Dormibacteraeota bacterium]|nr:alpha/beta fold hydrolase [Candidatus Dormibacteraeota bacterium]